MGALGRSGAVDRMPQPVVPALERRLVPGPHPDRDLQRLLQPLESFGHRRQRQAQGLRLLVVVPGADPQPGTPTAEHVKGGDSLHQQRRRPQGRSGHHGPQPDPFSPRGEEPERGVRLEHLGVLRRGGRVRLNQVVRDPHGVHARLVGGAGQPHQLSTEPAWAARPREVRHTDADTHPPRLLRAFLSCCRRHLSGRVSRPA